MIQFCSPEYLGMVAALGDLFDYDTPLDEVNVEYLRGAVQLAVHSTHWPAGVSSDRGAGYVLVDAGLAYLLPAFEGEPDIRKDSA